eukprot:768701-Hanusia_phi.AAC.2
MASAMLIVQVRLRVVITRTHLCVSASHVDDPNMGASAIPRPFLFTFHSLLHRAVCRSRPREGLQLV